MMCNNLEPSIDGSNLLAVLNGGDLKFLRTRDHLVGRVAVVLAVGVISIRLPQPTIAE